MTPTIKGRIQTRLFLLATVGVMWTLLIGPLLVDMMSDDGAGTGDVYRLAFAALVLAALLGVGWEFVYHAIQQYRWEKDWPTLFGLVVGIPEGLLIVFVLSVGIPWDVGEIPGAAFTTHFGTTWVLVWLMANGPMRVLSLRWRYDGGQLL